MSTPTEVIQQAYAAFGRRDIALDECLDLIVLDTQTEAVLQAAGLAIEETEVRKHDRAAAV